MSACPDTLGTDAFALGVALYAQGKLDLARHWLDVAIRYGAPGAAEKLAELTGFTEQLADIDFLGQRIDHLLTDVLGIEEP